MPSQSTTAAIILTYNSLIYLLDFNVLPAYRHFNNPFQVNLDYDNLILLILLILPGFL